MYLLILEDGEVRKTRTVAGDDFAASHDGLMQIIEMDPNNPREYYRGEWSSIPSWNEGD